MIEPRHVHVHPSKIAVDAQHPQPCTLLAQLHSHIPSTLRSPVFLRCTALSSRVFAITQLLADRLLELLQSTFLVWPLLSSSPIPTTRTSKQSGHFCGPETSSPRIKTWIQINESTLPSFCLCFIYFAPLAVCSHTYSQLSPPTTTCASAAHVGGHVLLRRACFFLPSPLLVPRTAPICWFHLVFIQDLSFHLVSFSLLRLLLVQVTLVVFAENRQIYHIVVLPALCYYLPAICFESFLLPKIIAFDRYGFLFITPSVRACSDWCIWVSSLGIKPCKMDHRASPSDPSQHIQIHSSK